MLMGRANTEFSVKRLKTSSNLVIGLICLLDQMHLLGYKYVKSCAVQSEGLAFGHSYGVSHFGMGVIYGKLTSKISESQLLAKQ